jgi:hypothetical protein
MGSRNHERDRRFGADSDLLAHYRQDYALLAQCAGPNCAHSRKVNVEQLLRWLGPKATIRDMRRKLRCSRCNTREPHIAALWVGKRGDGR